MRLMWQQISPLNCTPTEMIGTWRAGLRGPFGPPDSQRSRMMPLRTADRTAWVRSRASSFS